MSQSQKVRIGFERRGIDLAVDAILPIRQVKPSDQCFGKYRAVLASIKDATLLRTDRDGWIEISTDGEQLWVDIQK